MLLYSDAVWLLSSDLYALATTKERATFREAASQVVFEDTN